ncbi:MAG: tripartite tricarboxylate transporter substrate binding protein [Neomegalonema sp.]|nr:tripartite tricarboxylate transporter substrate binding protein [Neomegalonema sp.]
MTPLTRLLRAAVLVCALVVGAQILPMTGARAEYPDRPITLVVPWAAGGGTDATARIIAALLERELGKPVNVVNRTGGSGVVGHTAIALAKPDGYTIGVITVEIGMMHWAGLTALDWRAFTPIALYNTDPAGLHVRADSSWRSVQDVLRAARARPGAHKASGTGQGGVWHLALAGMLRAGGAKVTAVPWVPSKGAAPGLQELVAGGVDIVTSSVAEADGLIRAGRVKPLAVMSADRLPSHPDVPTLLEAAGLPWEAYSWRGLAGPKGMSPRVQAKLVRAMERVYASPDFVRLMKKRGFGVAWAAGDDFADWMARSDRSLGKVMKALGLAR